MSETAVAAPQKTTAKTASDQKSLAMQRKCACGQHTMAGGECQSCRKKRLEVQRRDKDDTGPSMLTALPAAVTVEKHQNPSYDLSRIQLRTTQSLLQRQPRGEAGAYPEGSTDGPEAVVPTAVPADQPAETAAEAPTTEAAVPTKPAATPTAPVDNAGASFVVEDDMADLEPGQLRKSDFIAELRPAVRAAAEAALAGTDRSTEGCPYLDYWFDYYAQQGAVHGERALRRFAPEAANATSARDYIPLVSERVRQGVARWASTGEVSGVPAGMPTTIPGEQPPENGQTNRAIQFKARAGGARSEEDPAVIQEQLGSGRALDSGVRSRMEGAFGTSFSHVQMHNDSHAAGLSSDLNARAFTVGEHVAFGAGEYQPGTLMGEALIAHELAHVVQQSAATDSVANMEVGDSGYDALEKDADQTAVNVLTSLWQNGKDKGNTIAQNATSHLRSGLRLQRCSNNLAASASRLQPHDSLWYFCGETQSGFTTTGILTAENYSNAADVNWTIAQGSDKVEFVGGSTGASVTIQGTAGSASTDDVQIEAREGTNTPANIPLTVRKPNQMETVGSPNDQSGCPPWAAGCGSPAWWTRITYRLKDNLNDTLQSVDVNENFPGTKTDDQTNNWVDPASFSTVPHWSASETSAGTFVDNWFVWGGSPSPVAPTATNAGTSVDQIPHEFYVGSTTSAQGCRVQTHTAHRYLGYARHESITTPAP